MKHCEAAGGLRWLMHSRLLDDSLGPSVHRTVFVAFKATPSFTIVFSRFLVPLPMSEEFYLPLDSVIKSTPTVSTANMESENIQHQAGTTLPKDPVEVNVAEISSDSSPTEIEALKRRTSKHPGDRSPLPDANFRPLPHHDPGFTSPLPRYPVPDMTILPLPHEGGPGFLRPTSPTGSVRSSFGGVRRRVVRRRFSGGHSHHGHHSEVSKELTLAAESEFLALTELMSSMARRSSSLKEVWMKLISERETHCNELDRLYERIEEYTEIIERHERESHGHNHEHEERKKELVKLRLELSVAIASISEWKRKFNDRDGDLSKAHSRISELEDLYKYSEERYEESRTTIEQKSLEIIAIRDRCEHAEEDARKHESEGEVLRSKLKKLEASFTEIASKYKSSQLEISTLRTQNETFIKERHDWQHEKGELEDKLRRRDLEIVNLKTEIEESNTTLTKKKRELHESEETNKKLSETIKKTKNLLEESEEKISKKKREYQELLVRYGNIEDTCGKLKTKCLHYEEQISTFKSTITRLETERTTLTETLTEVRSKYSDLEIIHEELKREHHGKCKESEDRHRLILVHEQTITRLESSVKEKTELIHTHRESIERLTTDCEAYKNRCEDYIVELDTFRTSIANLTLQIDVLTSERDSYCERYNECETKYIEICQWRDEFHGGNSEFEYEIASLRGMLKDVREERERAIKKREEADRDRDEATSKYESGGTMRGIVVIMLVRGSRLGDRCMVGRCMGGR
ncbi:hypothetical protein T440DRAFT_540291 [Plenodomus tracheiphilus IPT5]|uniref:Uncharacterized protein n=1 Tax=Plenodomus tracheiphilus IPT5 TaxID=1408161 RepID=A0A6A7AUY6_9PLEO|nr:hypothetical protein T440DRAFT_540291 [Plenodomus tracheiphilus IPT5]